MCYWLLGDYPFLRIFCPKTSAICTALRAAPFIKLSDLKELQVVIPEANQKEKISKTLKREDDISKQIKKLQKEQLDLSKDVWNI